MPKLSRVSAQYVISKVWETYLNVFIPLPNEFYVLDGYLHPLEGRFLYWLARNVPDGGLALEVGSYKGKSSCCLAAGLRKDARLACVDTWMIHALPYDLTTDMMPLFLESSSSYRKMIETHRGLSAAVAASWNRPIDLLFVDGDHSYDGCGSDIRAWLPFVRPGGWVAFHDSAEVGVSRAIAEFFPQSARSRDLLAWSILAASKI
jgi:predicted O-methyltransferase YrrM